jgi:acetyltransferase-like isoleucine patch superfamily enzyme
VLGYVQEDRIERLRLTVGHDVWIGAKTHHYQGLYQDWHGAVIGAGSIVTHDMPPYSVMAGNPARLLRERFPQEIIDALEASEWFNLEPDVLAQCINCVDKPLLFVEKKRR